MVSPPDNDVLWARGLRHAHQGSPALVGASLAVRAGEILGVLGARGCGKTTLLHCLSGRLRPDQGEVWFNSSPVHTLTPAARERLRRDRFGWIGDTPDLLPELTAAENAALPLLLRGVPHRSAKHAAQEWLDRLDVGDTARSRPAELPQAKRQRIAIARALVGLPDVLFADDPTAPLHRADRAQLLRTLVSAARSHRITVVLTTSDPEVVAHSDRVVTMTDGRPAPAVPAQQREGADPCSASV